MNLLVVPPLVNFLGVALGLALSRRWKRSGRWIAALSGASLVLFATPITGALLLVGLQRDPALPPTGPLPPAEAIVILGADQEVHAPEYGVSTLGALTLERLRYGASLGKRTQKPVLVSGGVLRPGLPPLAEVMRGVLEDELALPVGFVERRSSNTRQNARYSAELLRAAGLRRVYLVTHAWHMPRARRAFEVAGLEVVPAPMGFRVRPRPSWGDFLPSAKGLRQSALGMHEWIGGLVYRLRGS